MAPIAISTATTLEGTRQGMAQGELQGARSNLQTIVRIFAPLVRLKRISLALSSACDTASACDGQAAATYMGF